ncbi:hypothetical protein BDZ45DRAFT_801629 [Acephala macrosclerotiorum]|nr:hypothetical protein BDZ45DRAFT_801629 [Acephala macrosclerotiorum]
MTYSEHERPGYRLPMTCLVICMSRYGNTSGVTNWSTLLASIESLSPPPELGLPHESYSNITSTTPSDHDPNYPVTMYRPFNVYILYITFYNSYKLEANRSDVHCQRHLKWFNSKRRMLGVSVPDYRTDPCEHKVNWLGTEHDRRTGKGSGKYRGYGLEQ